jgi:hypothetical protein
MYPDWQLWFWWRSVFLKKGDFMYRDEKTGAEVSPGEGIRWTRRITMIVILTGAVIKRDWMMDMASQGLRKLDARHLLRGLKI